MPLQRRASAGIGRGPAPRIPALVPTAEETGRADRRAPHRRRRPRRRQHQGRPARGCTRRAGVHAARRSARRAPPREPRRQPQRRRTTAGSRPDDPLDADPRATSGLPAPAAGPARQPDQTHGGGDRHRPPATAHRAHSSGRLRRRTAGASSAAPAGGLFGGQLQGSATPRVAAGDARQPQPDPAQGHGLHLRPEDQGHQRRLGPRRLPGAAQRLQRRRPRAADRARLAPGRRVPRSRRSGPAPCASRCCGPASARRTA